MANSEIAVARGNSPSKVNLSSNPSLKVLLVTPSLSTNMSKKLKDRLRDPVL